MNCRTKTRRRAAAVLATLLLALVLAGCGSKSTADSPAPTSDVASAPAAPATPATPAAPPVADAAPAASPQPAAPVTTEEPAPSEPDAEIALEIDNWLNPVGLSSLLARFRELEWVWIDIENGVEQPATAVSYRLIGSETLQGHESTKVELIVDGSPWNVWLDERGDVVQAEIEGEMLPAEMTSMVVGPMLTGLFWPFSMVEAYRVDQVVADGGPGWETTVTEIGQRQYGDLIADVHEVRVTVSGPPYMAAGESSTLIWAIADFGPFQMLAEWHVIDTDTTDAFRMEIVRVVPK